MRPKTQEACHTDCAVVSVLRRWPELASGRDCTSSRRCHRPEAKPNPCRSLTACALLVLFIAVTGVLTGCGGSPLAHVGAVCCPAQGRGGDLPADPGA